MSWIKVEDEMPPNFVTVWIYDKGVDRIFLAYYHHENNAWFSDTSALLDSVTYWQPTLKLERPV